MGGSGNGSPNSPKGVRITFKDGSTVGFRVNNKGVILDLLSGTPTELGQGMTIKGIIKNAKKNGLGIETFNKSQLKNIDKQHAQDRLDLRNGLIHGKDNQVMREASRKWRVKMNRSGALFS